MFLCNASEKHAALADRELYLSEERAADEDGYRAAAVPEEREFSTGLELVRRMIERVLEAGSLLAG